MGGHSITNQAPSPWIFRFSGIAQGPVLDVACGAGRHAALFAGRGFQVTAVDRDLSRLGDLRDHANIAAMEVDLETEPAPWRPDPGVWGTVVVANYLWRPLIPALVSALAPGGVLLYETFAVGNGKYGKPSNSDFLLRPGELLDAVSGQLQVVAYEHGETPSPAVVQRICAIRSEAPVALT